ncbi:LysR substrate-binding domain-containing protein [Moritella viscosa]|uniref:Transcriptional regulator, LysR family n=1 Tax=Moritella viscosa TaxID=80854 RepID=A0A1L0A4T7_9GAMM|nr:LysR substrate-binding domain-containing protein [Moritella viscosa]SGY94144.1 Putative transcriptional regulator, LysR family [Moritella viscosa]SGY99096.1 Putative transcriptional regulator, LysR family [Moritella viscosa]SGY99444.1 Putative transcriptional regulator, LysR family [Moritella viscosa]SGZ05466.1 Putative transcriptional regulator, LysR family [Moritella viscosa]SGZ05720.1 Putative transcriptional regulator, LysR family [Moritella viscosa]
MSDWSGVSEFVAVAETESFTAAAKRLGISTAQVSRQVSALEERLSAKLFYRTTRKVSVTEVGGIYYQHCRQVMDGLADAERAITNLQSTPKGKLKITAPITYGERSVAPLVNDFVMQYPELEVQLVLSNQQIDLIDEGFDLAIRLGQLGDSSMIGKRLAIRKQYVCAAPEYLSAFGAPHTLSELERHNCLSGTLDYWRFQEKGKARNIRVKGNFSCNSGPVLVDAALKGVGIVQLPDYYVQEYINQGQLIELLPNYREPDDAVWALYPQNRHLSPKVRMLVDYLAKGLAITSS